MGVDEGNLKFWLVYSGYVLALFGFYLVLRTCSLDILDKVDLYFVHFRKYCFARLLSKTSLLIAV